MSQVSLLPLFARIIPLFVLLLMNLNPTGVSPVRLSVVPSCVCLLSSLEVDEEAGAARTDV